MTDGQELDAVLFTCPKPHKVKSSEAGARARQAESEIELFRYECRCGYWHLTKRLRMPAGFIIPELDRDDLVQWLFDLPTPSFHALVVADLRGLISRNVIRAFTDPVLVGRWGVELNKCVVSFENRQRKLKHIKRDGWWEKNHATALELRESAIARRSVARQIIASVDAGGYIEVGSRVVLQSHLARGRIAAERALELLIERHEDEFAALVGAQLARFAVESEGQ